MKQFLKDIGVYAIIGLLTIIAIHLLSPTLIGNPNYAKKLYHFENSNQNYNTVFYGNSLINRQLNPRTFDEYTKKKTKTFNLAWDATPQHESSFLIENFLEKNKVDRIVVPITGAMGIHEVNLHTARVSYFLNKQSLSFAFKYFKGKRDQYYNHILSYLEKLLCVNRIKNIIVYNKDISKLEKPWREGRGFYALDKEFFGENSKKNQAPGYLKEKVKYEKKLKAQKRAMGNSYKIKNRDLVIQEECKRLEKIGEKYDTDIIFLFFPNSPVFKHFEVKKAIYVGDGIDFPEYYTFENRYNRGHLNSVGAEMFSKRVAEKFNEL